VVGAEGGLAQAIEGAPGYACYLATRRETVSLSRYFARIASTDDVVAGVERAAGTA